MDPFEITGKLKTKFPGAVLDVTEFRGQVSVHLDKASILDVCRFLHDDPEMDFDYLMDLCGVDYMGRAEPAQRFEVVYHLYSIARKHLLRLRARVPEEDARVASLTPIWNGANWHERECYDMFGIVFEGHPELKRILLPEDWQGFPLRKDYPVAGPGAEDEWPGFKEVLETSRKLKENDWQK
ncbi:MAG: NADH-quinone oxidoreductase subunit C [Actinomycetota bacterium]|nr:NADH-quinone oxidoreductase subunit C [Actinomycetota bacterium]